MKVHPSLRITAERVIDDARTDTLTTVFGPTLGIRVERASEIAPALLQALAANRPVVIDVATDIDALAPTAVS